MLFNVGPGKLLAPGYQKFRGDETLSVICARQYQLFLALSAEQISMGGSKYYSVTRVRRRNLILSAIN